MISVILIATAACAEPGRDPDQSGPPAPAVAEAAAPAPAAPYTPPQTLTDWSRRAEAVAVVRIDRAEVFETAEPPFLSTRYTATVVRPLTGAAPATFVLRGGTLGDRTELASETPRLEVGGSYLGVFWPGAQLVFAPPMIDATHAAAPGETIAIDAVPALVRAAQGGRS